MDLAQEWPPLPMKLRAPMREWDAWWSGSSADLDGVYANDLVHPKIRPSQMAGGVVGSAARWFWGAPPENQVHRVHIPLANDVAAASADLLFGEQLEYLLENQLTKDRLDYILEGNEWLAKLPELGEMAAALGGVYLGVGWDREIADHVLLTQRAQDHVIPTWSYGRLRSATAWEISQTDSGDRVWRHLEIHTPGQIENQLWLGTSSKLGDKRPLNSITATAHLPEGVQTGYPGLALHYVPNVRPMPAWRNDPMGRCLGRADIGTVGVTGLLDDLDEVWSSWMRDIRLGKARLIVSSEMLDSRGPGQGATFDLDRELYEGVKFLQGEDSSLTDMISAQQFGIRYIEHAATVDALVKSITRACGYSGSTFGMVDGDAAKTATEVDSIDRRSAQTRERKTRYWDRALTQFLTAALVIDHAQFRAAPPPQPGDLNVVFPASSEPDPKAVAETIQLLRAAEAISLETAVKMAQPDLGDDELEDEIARIKGEIEAAKPVIPDPMGLAGADDEDEPPTDQPPNLEDQ